MSERNYEDECGDHGGTNSAGDPCGRPSGWGTDFGSGKCKHHRGTNADFLTDAEQERVKDAVDVLGTPEGAQEQAKVAAVIALEQFRRTGDDRFMRRYESICDTFGITPDDAPDTDVDVTIDATNLSNEEKDMLNAAFDRDPQE